MSFKNWLNIVRLLPFAVVAFPAFLAERHNPPHNLIVLVPTVLPAAAVSEVHTPLAAEAETEGVYFSNSHSGFPRLVVSRPGAMGAHIEVSSVLDTAAASHSTALVDSATGSSLDMIVDVTLPRFKAANKPFVLVYRFGRQSDDTQKHLHRQTDGNEQPAWVNAAITADQALAAIEDKLHQFGLYQRTNIIVAAEHGTSIVWKGGKANGWINLAAEQARWGTLPPGFLAMDLAVALTSVDRRLTVFDPDDGYSDLKQSQVRHPRLGNGVIGFTFYDPLIYVQARGDHDFVYFAKNLSNTHARRFAKNIIQAVFQFAYTSGVFVNEPRVGRHRGTLPLKHLGWHGSNKVPYPTS